MQTVDSCENCGAMIGKLEVPCVWENHVVCRKCHITLQAEACARAEAETPVKPVKALDSLQVISDDGRGQNLDYESRQRFKATATEKTNKSYRFPIICPNPNCGYKGEGKRRSKGSIAVLIILLFIMVLPGLLYMIFYSGYEIVCPRCGVKVRDDS